MLICMPRNNLVIVLSFVEEWMGVFIFPLALPRVQTGTQAFDMQKRSWMAQSALSKLRTVADGNRISLLQVLIAVHKFEDKIP